MPAAIGTIDDDEDVLGAAGDMDCSVVACWSEMIEMSARFDYENNARTLRLNLQRQYKLLERRVRSRIHDARLNPIR